MILTLLGGVFFTHARGKEPAIGELLGMNCTVPTDICFSFTCFRAAGLLGGKDRRGWLRQWLVNGERKELSPA